MYGYPVFPVGNINKKYVSRYVRQKAQLTHRIVSIEYPTRINAVVLDQSKVAPNKEMVFPGGEILFSVGYFIKVKTTLIDTKGGEITFKGLVKRKALVKHAYYLMCDAIGVSPSLQVEVDERNVLKHSGLGSSGAVLAATCTAINEMYNCPINDLELLQYIAGNYDEEVDDTNDRQLQCNPCFGGSISTGLFSGGIQILAGFATPIFETDYEANILIGTPSDYVPFSASEEIARHARYLFGNKDLDDRHGPLNDADFNRDIAYELLHSVLPHLVHGDFSELGKLSYRFSFDMWNRSVNDASWLYPKCNDIANQISHLFSNGCCTALGISSVGPSFYAVVENENQENDCLRLFEKQQLNCSIAPIYNEKYQVQYA